MYEFVYSAIDQNGKIDTGQIRAASEPEALKELATDGLTVIKMSIAGNENSVVWYRQDISLFGPVVGSKTVSELSQLMGAMLKQGITLPDALQLTSENATSVKITSICERIRRKIVSGKNLEQALASENELPEFFRAMLGVGEASNNLPGVFLDLADYYDEQARLKTALVSKLIYPSILVVATFLLLGVIVFGLVPNLEPLFAGEANDLPRLISLLASINEFLVENIWPVAATAFSAFVVALFFARSTAGKASVSLLLERMPLLAPITQNLRFSRYARMISMFLRAGDTLEKALEQTIAFFGADRSVKSLEQALQNLKEGASPSTVFHGAKGVPSIFYRMFVIGEKTNRLESLLRLASDNMQAVASRRTTRLAELITPIVTLVIGISIAGIAYIVLSAVLGVSEVAF